MGWIPPPESELSEVMDSYFEAEYLTKLGTIHGLLDSDPVIDIHLFDEGVKIILHTQGMATRPIPTDSGQEELRFVEIEMALPQGWPTGDEMLKTDEAAWPVQWLRRLAYHPHQDEPPIGKLFFYPNGSPPKPFANNTEMCFWMLMLSNKPPVYISEEKQIMIYIAVLCTKRSTNWFNVMVSASLVVDSTRIKSIRTRCFSERTLEWSSPSETRIRSTPP